MKPKLLLIALLPVAVLLLIGAGTVSNTGVFYNLNLGYTTNVVTDSGTALTRNGVPVGGWRESGTTNATLSGTARVDSLVATNGVNAGASTFTSTVSAAGAITGPSVTGTNSGTFGSLTVNTNATVTGSVTAGTYDIPLLSTNNANTNIVVDFATLGYRVLSVTNDLSITVQSMPASVVRTIDYKIYTGDTNRAVVWQTGLSNSIGAPLPAILPSNNVVRLTFQSTGTSVTNVDVFTSWRIP